MVASVPVATPYLMTSNKSISFHFQDNIMFYNADPFYLENAISNLIDNAIKYGGDMITIDLIPNKNSFNINISDNGTSLNKSSKDQIFEKFYRAHTGNLHNVKGFGLGMSYVKTVIDAHKGHISVASKLGEGSVFTVQMDLAK